MRVNIKFYIFKFFVLIVLNFSTILVLIVIFIFKISYFIVYVN